MLGGAVISWGFKKQTIISTSIMKSELIVPNTCCTTTEWIRDLLLDISLLSAISIFCDRKAVIDLVKQSYTNKKMNRHLQVRYKSIRVLLKRNVISLDFVKSEKKDRKSVV